MENLPTQPLTPPQNPPSVVESNQAQNLTPPPVKKSGGLKSKWPFLLIALLLVLVAGFGGYIVLNQTKNSEPTPTPPPEQVACTMEAKLCPDGVTSVGRSGPNCEFAACPTPTSSSSADTSDWKLYTNSKYEISFKYPSDWSFKKGVNDFSFGLAPLSKPPKDGYADPIAITRFDNPKSLSLKDWEAEADKEPGPAVGLYSANAENTTVDSKTAYMLKNSNCEPTACDMIIIMDGTNIFSFIYLKDSYSYSKEEVDANEKIFSKIISTIKFN